MITKEIVKDYADKKCQYMAYLMLNEKDLLRAVKDILDKNPDVLFKAREDEDEDKEEVILGKDNLWIIMGKSSANSDFSNLEEF